MFDMKRVTFAVWIYTLFNNAVTEKSADVELSPLNTVVRVGDRLNLTCRASFCSENVTFVWTTLLDKYHGGEVKNERTVSSLLIGNISVNHDTKIVCAATCGKEKKEKTSVIRVYSFPEDPVVDKRKRLRANQEQKFICTVYNIYPVERLEIEWFLGEKKQIVDDPYMTSDHVQNYSSEFTYTPSVEDLGKNITCKATLTLDKEFKQTRSSIAEYGPGNMIISNNTSVKLGEHLEITCHADGNPKPTVQWWKLEKTGATIQSQNHTLIINNAFWSQAGWYQCNASNVVGSMEMKVKVMVQGPPRVPKIQHSHSGEAEEGENVTVLCSSDDGPAELTLYRPSHSTVKGGLRESAVRLHMPSIQMTDAGTYVCEAKNDFGSNRSTINITVKVQQTSATMPELPVAVLPTVGSLSLLTVAGLLIRFWRKKARSGSSA